jgi:hypothetical protein
MTIIIIVRSILPAMNLRLGILLMTAAADKHCAPIYI